MMQLEHIHSQNYLLLFVVCCLGVRFQRFKDVDELLSVVHSLRERTCFPDPNPCHIDNSRNQIHSHWLFEMILGGFPRQILDIDPKR